MFAQIALVYHTIGWRVDSIIVQHNFQRALADKKAVIMFKMHDPALDLIGPDGDLIDVNQCLFVNTPGRIVYFADRPSIIGKRARRTNGYAVDHRRYTFAVGRYSLYVLLGLVAKHFCSAQYLWS